MASACGLVTVRTSKARRAVLALSLAFLATASALPAATIRVSPNSQLSVQQAIAKAKDGDMIALARGVYRSKGPLTISGRESLTLVGEAGAWLVCDDIYENVIEILDSSDISIEGIGARHAQPLEEYGCEGAVISCEGTIGLAIMGCELSGCGAIGVALADCDEVEIADCWIHDNSYAAFTLTEVATISISGCTIEGNAALMYSSSIGDLSMEGNAVSDDAEDSGE
ncbi:MAG: right-handed parallel beta-helix repeat-containing protein [Spirochaetes bacterium]|nr:right-handed parallel beta-helix repeat-containing protein [Spirochaetota bacterium]